MTGNSEMGCKSSPNPHVAAGKFALKTVVMSSRPHANGAFIMPRSEIKCNLPISLYIFPFGRVFSLTPEIF